DKSDVGLLLERVTKRRKADSLAWLARLLLNECVEGTSWSHFQKDAAFFLKQLLCAIGKTYRPSQVLRPIDRIGGLSWRDPCPSQVGDEWDIGRLQLHLPNQVRKGVENGIHHGGMECMRRVQPLRSQSFFGEPTFESLHCFRWPRQDTYARSVD